jgi:hypothetical protein
MTRKPKSTTCTVTHNAYNFVERKVVLIISINAEKE